MYNLNISVVLKEIADLLKIDKANNYKINSYEKASKLIKNLDQNLKDIIQNDELTNLSGIGSGLANTIQEIALTGECKEYKKLTNKYPISLISLLKINGIGASTAKRLYEKLQISNLNQLYESAQKGELSQISGIGRKTEVKIKTSAERMISFRNQIKIDKADDLAERLINYCNNKFSLNEIYISGELRRRCELINQLSLLVSTSKMDFKQLKNSLSKLLIINEKIKETEKEIVFKTKFGVELKFKLIQAKKLAINNLAETGPESFFEKITEKFSGSYEGIKEEKTIFEAINLPYIIPEIRDFENVFKVIKNNKLPKAIKVEDIKGDLHMHSTWSDGKFSIKQMAKACMDRGYEYLAISDHTQTLKVANGLTPKRLNKQLEEIDRLNQALDIEILKGAEVDILADGLDYPNQVLKKLDIVTASVHSGFEISEAKMMSRIFRALENPYVNVLGHPTGRILAGREGYSINLDQVIDKAITTGTILEINSSPKRLDLNVDAVRYAQDKGANFVVNTDAHSLEELNNIVYGIDIAKKGLLRKENLVNTMTKEKLKKVLKK